MLPLGRALHVWAFAQEALCGATFESSAHSWSQELPSAALVNSKLIQHCQAIQKSFLPAQTMAHIIIQHLGSDHHPPLCRFPDTLVFFGFLKVALFATALGLCPACFLCLKFFFSLSLPVNTNFPF